MANKSLVNRLNKRVTIRKQVFSKNSMGEQVQALEDYAKVWASVEPLQGREFTTAQRTDAEVTTKITIRHRDDIDRSMVVSFNNLLFEIMYIIHPNFNKRELQLMCKERQ